MQKTRKDTLLSLQFGGGQLELFLADSPQCSILFKDGELLGSLYETLAAVTAIVGGACLDKSVSFSSNAQHLFTRHLFKKGGIARTELPALRNLLRLASSSFAVLGTDGRNKTQDEQYYGYFAGAYPDRVDPDKFLIVYVTSGMRRDGEPLSNGECGCFATRVSLSDTHWAESVPGVRSLCSHTVNRTLTEQDWETVLRLDKTAFMEVSREMLDADPLPSKCFLNALSQEL